MCLCTFLDQRGNGVYHSLPSSLPLSPLPSFISLLLFLHYSTDATALGSDYSAPHSPVYQGADGEPDNEMVHCLCRDHVNIHVHVHHP